MRDLVYGIFHHEDDAAKAVRHLLDLDFSVDDVTVLMKEGDTAPELAIAHRTGIARGAAIGAALGAVGGALVSAGFGLFAAGALAAALEGAVAGVAAGTALGGMGGLGYWDDRVEFPSEHLENGAVLVGVFTENRIGEAQGALQEMGALTVEMRTKLEAAVEVSEEAL